MGVSLKKESCFAGHVKTLRKQPNSIAGGYEVTSKQLTRIGLVYIEEAILDTLFQAGLGTHCSG